MPTFVYMIIVGGCLVFVYYLYIANVKGAPFVPTPKKAALKMLKLAEIQPGEEVIDIGCGDGRLVILADQLYQADATGYEVSPPIYWYAKLLHKIKKTKTRAKILFKDSRLVDFSSTDVIITFLTPAPLKNFWKEKWEAEMKPSARIISYAFEIEGWIPQHIEPQNPEENIAPIYVYKISDQINS